MAADSSRQRAGTAFGTKRVGFTRPVRLLTMQRLALFDLDNTLVDRSEAFRRWAAEFCDDNGLPDGALAWLIATDQDGSVPRDWFFGEVTDRFGLASADTTWGQYRRPADGDLW